MERRIRTLILFLITIPIPGVRCLSPRTQNSTEDEAATVTVREEEICDVDEEVDNTDVNSYFDDVHSSNSSQQAQCVFENEHITLDHDEVFSRCEAVDVFDRQEQDTNSVNPHGVAEGYVYRLQVDSSISYSTKLQYVCKSQDRLRPCVHPTNSSLCSEKVPLTTDKENGTIGSFIKENLPTSEKDPTSENQTLDNTLSQCQPTNDSFVCNESKKIRPTPAEDVAHNERSLISPANSKRTGFNLKCIVKISPSDSSPLLMDPLCHISSLDFSPKMQTSFSYKCVVNICITLFILMYLLFHQPLLTRKADESLLLSLTRLFFHDSPFTGEKDTKFYLHRSSNGASCKYVHEKSREKMALFDELYEVISHPWMRCAEDNVADSDVCKTCQWSDDSLCKDCQESVKNCAVPKSNKVQAMGSLSRMAGQWSMVVQPLTRFLPDTTNNPTLDLAHVGYRLATLSALPPTVPVSRIQLADAGFYYRGRDDEVICYKCHTRHSGWTNEDKPMEVHRRISPNCPHVERDREEVGCAGNDPVTAVSPSSDAQPRTMQNTSRANVNNSHGMMNGQSEIHVEDGELPTSSVPVAVTLTATATPARQVPLSGTQETMPHVFFRSQMPTTSTMPPVASVSSSVGNQDEVSDSSPGTHASAGSATVGGGAPGPGSQPRQMFPQPALDLGGAVYPMYQDMASRRRSFPHWDERRAPPLDQLILCGMFYAGYADCVRCFYCGVGLKHWEVNDDVWEEHVRWRPSCGYLRAVKGDDYIRRTLARLGHEAAGEEEDGSSAQNRQGANSARPGVPSPPHGQQGPDRQTPPARPQAHSLAPSTPSSILPPGTAFMAPVSNNTTPTSTQSSGTTTATSLLSGPATSTTASSPASCNSNSQSSARPEGGSESAVSDGETPSLRVARLQTENRELAQRLRCKVCLQEPIDTILMPCGHLVVCESCARNVTHCPLCREHVRATARVHMS